MLFNYIDLKNFLDDKGLKQKCVAQKTGIQETVLSAILSGKRKCTLDEYIKICLVLDVPFTTFIDIHAAQPAA